VLEVVIEKAGILEGVEFSVPQGAVLGIAGKNGSGKTTLLKFISGVVSGRGKVSWKSVDLSDLPFRKRVKVVNVVPQNFDPDLYYSVYEVIDASAPISLSRDAIEDALERVGLAGFGGRIFAELSGGEKVRVLIARVLAINPSVILFDEPSAFLDPDIVASVVRVIDDLRKSKKTVLVVSHDISFLLEVGDLFLGLKKGRKVFFGEKDKFVDILGGIYDVPLKVLKRDEEIFVKPNYR